MKTPADLVCEVAKKVAATWPVYATAPAGAGDPGTFPLRFSLSSPSKSMLEASWSQYRAASVEWLRWAPAHGVALETASRVVFGSTQEIPTHATVPSFSVALALLGPDTEVRHARGVSRSVLLDESALGLDALTISKVVKLMDTWPDTDVALAIHAARWFQANDASGMTPRQVPLPGFHAKWLQSHTKVVSLLAGKDLGLRERPGRVHFTYLDPEHLAAGGRQHDSVTAGDSMEPVYQPRVVIISENKDTAVHFLPIPGGVAVEGEGYGPSAHASVPWLAAAPVVLYWGDLDQDGYEILNQFRSAGIAAQSILMDMATFDEYAHFGTMVDARGKVIVPFRKELLTLTVAERAVYERVTDPDWPGPLRVEQERIPLGVARAAALATLQ